ncbi:hypothetical protein XCR1_810003 [Xenorhabdus cabanillasii JM26]|uniref:Uncharacterized protein n=1 Tax=Xenorhabdus cabanillasii JM26 TaxID=1427517 RepID=W1JBQ2_9GAMM|nr:hypothetical protein XCR1_810003 [Xenorhabdus cabanillasii JM26]
MNRKTLCFSRPEKMYNKDTGTFIERENYKLYLIYVSNYLIYHQLALDGLFQFNTRSAPVLTSLPGFE